MLSNDSSLEVLEHLCGKLGIALAVDQDTIVGTIAGFKVLVVENLDACMKNWSSGVRLFECLDLKQEPAPSLWEVRHRFSIRLDKASLFLEVFVKNVDKFIINIGGNNRVVVPNKFFTFDSILLSTSLDEAKIQADLVFPGDCIRDVYYALDKALAKLHKAAQNAQYSMKA